jgi:hypothetical protein
VIAGSYLPREGFPVLVQEFAESPDGFVEYPRVTAGFEPNDYMQWTALNELALHYVISHSVNPNDLLGRVIEVRSGWPYLREKFEDYVQWLQVGAPSIRKMTAAEGAMAVQRFDRLTVSREMGETYQITLGNFYDEAWLLLRTSDTPVTVEGGAIIEVATDLYLIEATMPHITIDFRE